MKKIISHTLPAILFVFILFVAAAPAPSFAAGLVPCDNVKEACDFKALMNLVNTIIRFALFDLAIPIAAIMMAYAGFTMVTAQGGESVTKAKHIFSSAVFGIVFAAAAWLIVRTVLAILGYDGTWIGF